MWARGCSHDDWDFHERCEDMCCFDSCCHEKVRGDKFRFPLCLCWDNMRRCWINPRTGVCVDIASLELVGVKDPLRDSMR